MTAYGPILPKIILGPRFVTALASVSMSVVSTDQGDLVLIAWDEES
jgi:hypothetical protein